MGPVGVLHETATPGCLVLDRRRWGIGNNPCPLGDGGQDFSGGHETPLSGGLLGKGVNPRGLAGGDGSHVWSSVKAGALGILAITALNVDDLPGWLRGRWMLPAWREGRITRNHRATLAASPQDDNGPVVHFKALDSGC